MNETLKSQNTNINPGWIYANETILVFSLSILIYSFFLKQYTNGKTLNMAQVSKNIEQAVNTSALTVRILTHWTEICYHILRNVSIFLLSMDLMTRCIHNTFFFTV